MLLFSKLNIIFSRYFDLEKCFLCNEFNNVRVVLTDVSAKIRGTIPLQDVTLLYAKLPKCPEAAQLRKALQWVDVMDYVRMSPEDKDMLRAQRLSFATLVPPSCPTQTVRHQKFRF